MPLPEFKNWLNKKRGIIVEVKNEHFVDEFISLINEMKQEELLEIKGIGPKTATKIINALPVASLDDLPVNEKVAEKLHDHLSALQT